LVSTLRTPAFVARTAVHTPLHTLRAKEMLRRAFRYQVEGTCFSLVEFLSTCPTNWGCRRPRRATGSRRTWCRTTRSGVQDPEGVDRAPRPLRAGEA